MDTDIKDSAQRMVVCLVGDESVADRIPSALRSLQIGLIDEMIDLLLVVPQDGWCEHLAAGPTHLVTYRPRTWPLARMARKGITAVVVDRIQALKPTTPIQVHALTPGAAPLAARIAAATEGQLLLSIWSASELSRTPGASLVPSAVTLVSPSEVVTQSIQPRLTSEVAVETVPLGVATGAGPSAFKDPQRAPTLIFAGVLKEHTGIEAMLRAAARAVQHHPNLLVFLVGKGPGEADLRHTVERLNLDQQVIFTGRLEYLRAALEAADIFCLPSAAAPHREELIHAMAAGLAIIAPHRAPYDGLDDENTALMFSEGDEDALTTNLLRLLDDREAARRLGAAAQATAAHSCSVTQMVEGHARIYRRLDRRQRTFTLAQKEEQ